MTFPPPDVNETKKVDAADAVQSSNSDNSLADHNGILCSRDGLKEFQAVLAKVTGADCQTTGPGPTADGLHEVSIAGMENTGASADSIGEGSYNTVGRNPISDIKHTSDIPPGATVKRETDANGFVKEEISRNGEKVTNTYDEGELVSKDYPLANDRTLSVSIQDGQPNGMATISERTGHSTNLAVNSNGTISGERIDRHGKVLEKVALIDGKLVYEDIKTGAKRAEVFEPPDTNHVSYRVSDVGKYDANTGMLTQNIGEMKIARSFSGGRVDVQPSKDVSQGVTIGGEVSFQNRKTGEAAVVHPDGTGVLLKGDGTFDRWGPKVSDNVKGEKLSPVEQTFLKKHPETDLRDFAEIHRRFNGDAQKLDKFFTALEKIDSAKHLNDAQKAAVRLDLVDHVANPAEIYQGVTESCNVSVIQRDLAISDPAKYVETVTEAVSSGTVTTSDGTKVPMDVKNLLMADSSGRDLASRIFQTAALRAEFYPVRIFENTPDGIGRLKATRNSPDGTPRVEPFDGLYPNELAEIRYKLTGEEKAITFIKTGADLQRALELNGGPPMTILVDATHSPFGDASTDKAPNHVVTITGVEQGPPLKYLVQNQIGLEHDHSTRATAIPADQLLSNMSRHKESGMAAVTTTNGALVITKGDHTKAYAIVDGHRSEHPVATTNLAQSNRARPRHTIQTR